MGRWTLPPAVSGRSVGPSTYDHRAHLADTVTHGKLAARQSLLIVNVTFLILGMFLEVISLMLITLPFVLSRRGREYT